MKLKLSSHVAEDFCQNKFSPVLFVTILTPFWLVLKSVFSLPTSRYFSRPINTQWLGPKSFVVSDIYVCEVEPYVVTPARPWIYKRYIDDTYARRKKNARNTLFNSSNSYHKNINYLVKESYKIFGYKNNKTWQWNQNSGLHWTSKALTG